MAHVMAHNCDCKCASRLGDWHWAWRLCSSSGLGHSDTHVLAHAEDRPGARQVGEPAVVLLDAPSTGTDPGAAH